MSKARPHSGWEIWIPGMDPFVGRFWYLPCFSVPLHEVKSNKVWDNVCVGLTELGTRGMVPSPKLQGTKLWANIWHEHIWAPTSPGLVACKAFHKGEPFSGSHYRRKGNCLQLERPFFQRGWANLSRQWQTRHSLSKCCWELSCFLIRKQSTS